MKTWTPSRFKNETNEREEKKTKKKKKEEALCGKKQTSKQTKPESAWI